MLLNEKIKDIPTTAISLHYTPSYTHFSTNGCEPEKFHNHSLKESPPANYGHDTLKRTGRNIYFRIAP
jgi:hypothetical protein